MKTLSIINLLCVLAYCLTAFIIVDRIAVTYERTPGVCPGPLRATDYYTPEE